MEIEKRPSLPEKTYQQIVYLIKHDELKVGTKLPSEINLAKKFDVSRTALRDALKHLEFDGYVNRIHGVGTFVSSSIPTLEAGLEKLESITEFLKARGLNPGTKGETLTEERADQYVANKLQINTGESIIRLDRVREANGRPFAYDVLIGPPHVINVDFLQEYHNKESLFDYLESGKDMTITHSYCDIYAENATQTLAERLNISSGDALQVLEQTYYDQQNEILFYGTSYIRSDVLKFHLIRRR